MDPGSMHYAGYKFAHFMPNAIAGISPMIKYLIEPSHATFLFVFLIIFSIIEFLAGLGLMLGFFSRLSGLGTALLSLGILLGSGWIGPTCLDEWQIGVAGIGGGLILFLAGGGPWSLDSVWQKKWPDIANKTYVKWLTSGDIFSENMKLIKKITFIFALVGIFITIYTNQAFYGGVWGKLHNPSKHPQVTITKPVLNPDGKLSLTLYRNAGPDTYGAFIIKIKIKDDKGGTIESFNADFLSKVKKEDIKNFYISKAHPGKYSLVVPLSSMAKIKLNPTTPLSLHSGKYTIEVTDVSGTNWHTSCEIK